MFHGNFAKGVRAGAIEADGGSVCLSCVDYCCLFSGITKMQAHTAQTTKAASALLV